MLHQLHLALCISGLALSLGLACGGSSGQTAELDARVATGNDAAAEDVRSGDTRSDAANSVAADATERPAADAGDRPAADGPATDGRAPADAAPDRATSDASVADALPARDGAPEAAPSDARPADLAPSDSRADAAVAEPPALTDKVTLFVAGDSTAAVFPASDGRVGWASVLQPFFASGVTVNDLARSGRSSKSYYDEGAWNDLKAKIRKGDYVFIEFGHNDEKSDDPTRYTDPATTYRDYLKIFIRDTRAAGGYPVLLTSICRRQFSGTRVTGTHGQYTVAVFAVGADTGTPVIDMESRTKAWLEALGPTASVPMFATDDNTHLSAKGAPEVAKLAVQGIRDAKFPIAERLAP